MKIKVRRKYLRKMGSVYVFYLGRIVLFEYPVKQCLTFSCVFMPMKSESGTHNIWRIRGFTFASSKLG